MASNILTDIIALKVTSNMLFFSTVGQRKDVTAVTLFPSLPRLNIAVQIGGQISPIRLDEITDDFLYMEWLWQDQSDGENLGWIFKCLV